ncbi:hypothetical protein C8Q78DRAFT_996062 [Trametes maxima]|nr:hypothetical protein C8Q78DRAFT_996062 [Trametes maxima]
MPHLAFIPGPSILLLLTLARLVLATSHFVGDPDNPWSAPKQFEALPLGHVTLKPDGWLADNLAPPQPDTLLGTDKGFYDYLARADTLEWVTRPRYPRLTVEQERYGTPGGTLDFAVPRSQAEQFLDYFLDTQHADGWIGPESEELRHGKRARRLAGRFPFFIGAIRMVEARPAGARAGRVAAALHKFVPLAVAMLRRREGIDVGEYAFLGDFLVAIQWLLQFHPDGREESLVGAMLLVAGMDISPWDILGDENTPVTLDRGHSGRLPDIGIEWRGLNTMKALTTIGARYRVDRNASTLSQASELWDTLSSTRHSHPSGTFWPEARFLLSDTERDHSVKVRPDALYLYQLSGDIKYADRVERIVYNAVEVVARSGLWGQVCSIHLCRSSYTEGGPYAELFKHDHDPSCCSPLYPEGWPDYIRNAFMTTGDGRALVQVFLGPFSVNTTLTEDNKVSVTVDTGYPYTSESATTTIVAQKPFEYQIRIPSWSTDAYVSVNGGAPEKIVPSAQGLHAISIDAGTTKVALNLSMATWTEARSRGRVTIHRGPLTYALGPFLRQPLTSLDDLALRQAARASPRNTDYAIDPSTFGPELSRPKLYFGPTNAHFIAVSACPVARSPTRLDEFGLAQRVLGGDGGSERESRDSDRMCIGPVRNVTLIPYATAVLPYHAITEMATISLLG